MCVCARCPRGQTRRCTPPPSAAEQRSFRSRRGNREEIAASFMNPLAPPPPPPSGPPRANKGGWAGRRGHPRCALGTFSETIRSVLPPATSRRTVLLSHPPPAAPPRCSSRPMHRAFTPPPSYCAILVLLFHQTHLGDVNWLVII